MIINILEINQPIGVFYIGVLPAKVISSVSTVRKRAFDPDSNLTSGGVQRDSSNSRIIEISNYCSDPDATFPTPIIIAVDSNSDCKYDPQKNTFEFDENKILGEILDGQHRLKGIERSLLIDRFDLPVVFMFNLVPEEKAYIFSIINSTQTKVPKSLIYDLFGLTVGRSPQKTCHEIARLANSDEESPFYCRLKMLGKKEGELESLSQGSFIKYLLPLVSKNPNDDVINIKTNSPLQDYTSAPLRSYFMKERDEIIYKIITNVFSSLSHVFPKEWCDHKNYILSKTTGYGAVLESLRKGLYDYGKQKNDLSKDFFIQVFTKFKLNLDMQGLELTSKHFPSNEDQQHRLANLILQTIR